MNSLKQGRFQSLLRAARQKTIDLKNCVITRDIVCDHCHRAVSLSDFAGWRYKTQNYGFYIQRSPDFEKQLSNIESRDPAVAHNIEEIHRGIIHPEVVSDYSGYTITIFHLAQGCAIICADASEEVRKAPGGPDDQWRCAITEAVSGARSLRRGINLGKDKLGGRETNHDYTAHGKEYRLGYDIDHKDDSRVTESEDTTYHYLYKLSVRVLGHLQRVKDYPFLRGKEFAPNEFMSVGYWPGQRMVGHVDQNTIPPIATYSLGSGEMFTVIPRRKAHYGRSCNGDPGAQDAPSAGTRLGNEFQKI